MCHITVLMICREEIYEYDYGGGDRGLVNIFIIRSIPRLVISRNPQSTIIMSLVMDYFIITAFTDWHSVEGFLQFGVRISDGENMFKNVLIINGFLHILFFHPSQRWCPNWGPLSVWYWVSSVQLMLCGCCGGQQVNGITVYHFT